MNRGRGAVPSAAWVRTMFTRVAPRYDLLNHLLSFNQDRRWRARTASRLSEILARPSARVLDLCCGTGDLMLALQAQHPLPVLGCDFSRAMLARARRKAPRCVLVEADALHLPFADDSLDLITAAFGFRNLTDYHASLEEMRRALKPGGTLAILEFSQPSRRWWAALFGFYSRFVLPLAGGVISGEPTAYRYLPASVRRFPSPEELATDLRQAGFDGVTCELMSGGIVALHLARAE